MAEQPQREGSQPLKEIGGFELIAKIGQGGMGAVFKARQKSLDRIVALKVLPPSIAKDAKFIERFQREARACAKLNHPNIVQGVDVGKDSATGVWYFAMEFVDGPSALKLLKSEGVLSEQRALEIVRDIAKALECAAQHGIVHRDIKPDNILLMKDGEAKLADLGLAKQMNDDATLTQSGQAVGTPYYMSPEQVRGALADIDIRTDIYALGGTLFHLVTGKPPFEGETSAVIMSKHLTQAAPKANKVNPEVSDACSRLIERMMQKDREKRIANPTDLLTQIERVLNGETTTGPKQSVGSAPSRRKREAVEQPKSKAPLMLAGAGVAATVVVFMMMGQSKQPAEARTAAPLESPPITDKKPAPVAAPKKEQPRVAVATSTKPAPVADPVGVAKTDAEPPVAPTSTPKATEPAVLPEIVDKPEPKTAPVPPPQPEVAQAPAKTTPAAVADTAAKKLELPLADILAALHTNTPKKAVDKISEGNFVAKDAMLDALKLIIARTDARREAFEKLIGTNVKLDTTKGPQNGKLLALKNGSLQLERAIMINGESRGTTQVNVAMDDLTPATIERIAPTAAPSSPADWLATALVAMSEGQLDAADAAVGKLAGNELQDTLAAELKKTRVREREAAATAAWAKIEARASEAPSQTKAKQLIDELAAFSKKFGDSDFAASPEIAAKITEFKEKFERLSLGLDPRVLKLFKGRVLNYDAKTQVITLGYDFQTNEQTDDFIDSTWAPPGDHTGLTWRKGELRTFCKGTADRIFRMPQFVSGTLNIQLYFKRIDTSKRNRFEVEISFYGLDSAGKSPKISFKASEKGSHLLNNGAELKSDDDILFKADGVLELACQGQNYLVKENNKVILEHSMPKPNDHTGFWLGGGWDSGITFTKMQVSGRLDPGWMAKALESAAKPPK